MGKIGHRGNAPLPQPTAKSLGKAPLHKGAGPKPAPGAKAADKPRDDVGGGAKVDADVGKAAQEKSVDGAAQGRRAGQQKDAFLALASDLREVFAEGADQRAAVLTEIGVAKDTSGDLP